MYIVLFFLVSITAFIGIFWRRLSSGNPDMGGKEVSNMIKIPSPPIVNTGEYQKPSIINIGLEHEDLLNYISFNIDGGISETGIKTALLEKGWRSEIIEKAIIAAKNRTGVY